MHTYFVERENTSTKINKKFASVMVTEEIIIIIFIFAFSVFYDFFSLQKTSFRKFLFIIMNRLLNALFKGERGFIAKPNSRLVGPIRMMEIRCVNHGLKSKS
jgi:hypothetical protein